MRAPRARHALGERHEIIIVAREHGAHPPVRFGSALLGGTSAGTAPIDVRWRVFYNPDLSSRRFVVPGLMAVFLSILAATLTCFAASYACFMRQEVRTT